MLNGKMLIDGQWVYARSGELMDVVNPADNTVFAKVPAAGKPDVMDAVASANAAFESWAQTTPFFRGALLRESARLIRQKKADIAKLMTMEQGKPLPEAIGEVEKGADILAYYAEEGERVSGRIIPNADGNNFVSHVVYQPVGVSACISPWNYPIELLAWKVAAALAAGCSCVLKAPTETPLSPIEFVKVMMQAGFPDGVVNLITGSGRDIGPMLATHPDIRKIAFTGSTPVGRDIMEKSSGTLKQLSLELGGSLPMIICADCDLQESVKGAVRRSFRNMGQICIAVNRIYVERAIYEQFLVLFAKEVEKLVIGNGLTDQCDLGPMCTPKGVKTTKAHIEDALKRGAKLVCGGRVPEGEKFSKGNYFQPTVLRDVDHEMLIMREETFGPAVGVMPFDTVSQAIDLANDTPYGLAAIVYTSNIHTASCLSRKINAGNIAINNVDAGVINAPYGGWADSGFGHEHGTEGLYEYLNVKHIRIKTQV